MPEKTLLDPLTRNIPRKGKDFPARNKTSYKYQDSEGRYFFGAFPPPAISPHPTDRFYALEAGDIGRPDLLSYKFIKTPTLYWVILWINNITDPFEGMYPGMLIRVPSMTRLVEYNIKG